MSNIDGTNPDVVHVDDIQKGNTEQLVEAISDVLFYIADGLEKGSIYGLKKIKFAYVDRMSTVDIAAMLRYE